MTSKSTTTNSVFVCCRTSDAEDGHRDEIAATVRGLGRAAPVFPCCWYLETELDVSQLKMNLTPAVSETDTLVVIDATNHQTAWQNIFPIAAELIRESWTDGALPSPSRRMAPKRVKRER